MTALDSGPAEALFGALYGPEALGAQKKRWAALYGAFTERFGAGDARFFSAPGRTEIGGNHTDHNNGKVLAASIQEDCIAVVRATGTNAVRVWDSGYGEDFEVGLGETEPVPGEGGAKALVRGILAGFAATGFKTGGFDVCFSSGIPAASGVSSSAAFEMALCVILNNLYNNRAAPPEALAGFGQFAENRYWNKASGLQDQMASAVGGLVAIDFANPAKPRVEKIPVDFEARHLRLILVNTGGNHASLSEEYSAIPREMRSAARVFGQDTLRGLSAEDLAHRLPEIRAACGDRAALRAFHFVEENIRVEGQIKALKNGDFKTFLRLVRDSGNSSWKWLQNVYVPAQCQDQGVAVCLALTEVFIRKNGLEDQAACRVHGGGFAGVIQVFIPQAAADDYARWMLRALGKSSALPAESPLRVMRIRPLGALEITARGAE